MAEYGIYTGMEAVYEATGAKVVVDSAFNIGKKYYIVKPSQQDLMDPEELAVNHQATSIRQLSEWGMRMIQGMFLLLNDGFKYD